MPDQPSSRDRLANIAHHFLERLTVMKIHVGALRLNLRRGTLDPGEAEERLAALEGEIDAAATLAHDLRGEQPLSP